MVKFHRSTRLVALAALAIAGLALGACSSGGGSESTDATAAGSTPAASSAASSGPESETSAASGELKTVSLVYDWSGVDFEAVPLAVAKSEGMFAKAGIDLKLILPPDDSTTVKLLGSGQGDLGFATTADVVITRGQGADVLSIGNYSQVNNWGLIARPGGEDRPHPAQGQDDRRLRG